MAFSPEEVKIIQYGKEQGKTADEITKALSKFRLEQPAPKPPEGQGYIATVGQNIGADVSKRTDKVGEILNRKDTGVVENGLQVFGQGAGAAANAGEAIVGNIPGVKQASEAVGKGIDWLATSDFSPIKHLGDIIGSNKTLQEVTKLYDTDSNFRDTVDAAANIARLGGDVQTVVDGANFAKNVTNKVISGVKQTGTAIANVAKSSQELLSNTIDSFGERISSPEVSDATKVSLNPKEALKNSSQDIQVSVNGELKKLSEVTPEESKQMKITTENSLNDFTKQAEKFSKDRSVVGGSPVEMVGNKVDAALEVANKKRQVIGSQMGEIEKKYVGDTLPIGEKTLNTFSETLKSIDNPKFGVDTADAPIVKKLVTDFDKLEKGGATIGERLEFVRSWDKYLRDTKDAFGNFKENATANTRIQNAIKVLKDETVDAIATKDEVYKGLRSQYRTYKQLDEIGDSLLGKDGALGERIKGAATVKRAIQSNSDAGARQFLTKLKELTGYDAIKEGDIALTAMENVGDYQGLSLLNIIKEGKTGMINRALEYAQDKLVGNKATRVRNYIKK